jgi:3-phenylpropionate/cinnamic acid dioxygenase small subunit
VNDEIKTLLDGRAIEGQLYRYGEIHDSKEYHRLGEVFADNVQFSISTRGLVAPFESPPVARSLAELIEMFLRGTGPKCGITHCDISNVVVDLNGDSAQSTAHQYTVHQSKTDPRGFYVVWGDYNDTWTRTLAGWRIASRVAGIWIEESTAGFARGLA